MENQEFKECLINDICNYIDYLQNFFGYRITVHFADEALGSNFYRFLKYYYHNCSMCQEVKRSSRAWQHCVSRQHKVFAAASEHPILGTCYAGVSEYVFPLRKISGQPIAFVCLSGYCIDLSSSMERAQAVSLNYRLPMDRLRDAVSNLITRIPDLETISSQIAPLQNMFSLLFHLESRSYHNVGNMNPKEAIYLKMISCINSTYRDEACSMRRLAADMNLNYSYASHIFSEFSKTPFPNYLRSLRIEAAKKYLEYTDESVSMIAGLCGFGDSNYFSHIFKTETGLTPTQWRQRHSKKGE